MKDFKAYLLKHNPEKAAGEPEQWETPSEALRLSLERAAVPYQVDAGEVSFYGPNIDIKVKDALRREWQLSTIKFDFTISEGFELSFVGEDDQHHRPYMIHRALL